MPFFAKRTNFWQQESNALDKALQALSSPQGVLDLTQSNPTQAGFDYPAHWLDALSGTSSLSYDPQSLGLISAREAVSHYYQQRGFNVDPTRIMLTSSSSESYAHLLRLLVNPHEKVLIPTPSYPLFPYLLDIQDAAYVTYQLSVDHDWAIDRQHLLSQLDGSVKIIMVVSPNNPTGSFISDSDKAWLVDVANQHGIALVADEVFMDYGFNNQRSSFLNVGKGLAFIIGGLSKTACLPQMKLGWLIPVGDDDLVKGALARLEIMADTYLSVNTPVQLAACIWLKDVDIIQAQVMARLKENLAYAFSRVTNKIQLLRPQAGWYMMMRLPSGMDDEAFALQALRNRVMVYPGYYFDLPGDNYVVVSLLTEPKIFQQGWDKICQMI